MNLLAGVDCNANEHRMPKGEKPSEATRSTPLVGMLFLCRHNLNIEVERGGRVVIEDKA